MTVNIMFKIEIYLFEESYRPSQHLVLTIYLHKSCKNHYWIEKLLQEKEKKKKKKKKKKKQLLQAPILDFTKFQISSDITFANILDKYYWQISFEVLYTQIKENYKLAKIFKREILIGLETKVNYAQ